MDGLIVFFRSGDGFTNYEWRLTWDDADRYLFIVFGNPRKAALVTRYMDEDRRRRTKVMVPDDPSAIGFRQDLSTWIRGLGEVKADITYASPPAAAMMASIISQERGCYEMISVEKEGYPSEYVKRMPGPAVPSDDLPVILRTIPPAQAASNLHEILAMRRRSRGQRSEESGQTSSRRGRSSSGGRPGSEMRLFHSSMNASTTSLERGRK